jgi:hypothetical protein
MRRHRETAPRVAFVGDPGLTVFRADIVLRELDRRSERFAVNLLTTCVTLHAKQRELVAELEVILAKMRAVVCADLTVGVELTMTDGITAPATHRGIA